MSKDVFDKVFVTAKDLIRSNFIIVGCGLLTSHTIVKQFHSWDEKEAGVVDLKCDQVYHWVQVKSQCLHLVLKCQFQAGGFSNVGNRDDAGILYLTRLERG